MALFSEGAFSADPVQRPPRVERLGLASPVAKVTVDGERLLLGLGGSRVVTGVLQYLPQVGERVALAEPVTQVAVDAQRLLQGLGRSRVISLEVPQIPEVVERVGLAEPVTEATRGLERGRVPGDGISPRAVVQRQPGDARGERDNPGMRPAAAAWSRQASRLSRSALAQTSACPWSVRAGTAVGTPPSAARPGRVRRTMRASATVEAF